MLTRLLLDPDASGTAQGTTPPATTPAAAAPPGPREVTLSYADFQALQTFQAKAAALEAAEVSRVQGAKVAEEQRLIEKGQFEAAIKMRDERLNKEVGERDVRIAHLDRTFKLTLLEKELATALSSFPLVPGAAKQLTALLRDEFEVSEANGQFRVQTRTLEAVSDFLKVQLAGAEYEHFLSPKGQGGTGASGGNRTTTPASETPLTDDDKVFAAIGASRTTRTAAQGRGLRG